MRSNFYLSVLVLFTIFIASCKKENAKEDSLFSDSKSRLLGATPNADLITYKNTANQIVAGFYRTWRDRTVSGNANDPIMSELPDSLDIVIVFPDYTPSNSTFWTSLKNNYIPALHAKGTKVLITGSLNIASGVSHDAAGYEKTAKYIVDSIINKYNYDGYDIDVESNPSGSTLTDMVGVYKALSAYLGPKSGTSKLLTFNTNQDGTNSMFRQTSDCISYLFLQAYGRNVSSLQTTWNSFSPYITSDKFVLGFSFYEENGAPSNIWYDVNYPQDGTGRAYDYCRWEPSGVKKGGVFSYAIDRDAPLTSTSDNTIRKPNYRVTNDLIKILNPSSAIGVTFYADVNYLGAKSSALAKGNYTLSQLQLKGVVNDWASSVNLPSGWQIVMYADDNFSGTSWTLTSSNANFLNLSPSANDKVSSVKIQ